MKKVGKFIGCFMPILAALGCQLFVSFVGSFIFGIVVSAQVFAQGVTDAAEAEALMLQKMADSNMLMLITAFATITTLIVGALWFKRHRPQNDLSLKTVCNVKLLASMCMMGIALQLLISMCLKAVYPMLPQTLTDQYNELMETLIGGNVWLSLFVTVILAPLAEELLFRGVTLRKAAKIMPFMAANVLQAVLFGVYHMNLIQGIYAFVLGLLLGYVAEYFHSIWASILLHAFVNGGAQLLNLLPESISQSIVGVIGLAVVGVLLLIVGAKMFPGARTESVAAEPGIQESEKLTENLFDENE